MSSYGFFAPDAQSVAVDPAHYSVVAATDSDSDGIVDLNDKCPLDFDPDQSGYGGIGDACWFPLSVWGDQGPQGRFDPPDGQLY